MMGSEPLSPYFSTRIGIEEVVVNPNGVLLIVDDDQTILEALRTGLARHFAVIYTASTPPDAEAVLNRHPVTHLLCDNNLGAQWRWGIELIPEWRLRHTRIQVAVLHTGDVPDPTWTRAQVDKVVTKPAKFAEIVAGLREY